MANSRLSGVVVLQGGSKPPPYYKLLFIDIHTHVFLVNMSIVIHVYVWYNIINDNPFVGADSISARHTTYRYTGGYGIRPYRIIVKLF